MTITYVSADRCTLVREYKDDLGRVLRMEVATRPDTEAVWGPPTTVEAER